MGRRRKVTRRPSLVILESGLKRRRRASIAESVSGSAAHVAVSAVPQSEALPLSQALSLSGQEEQPQEELLPRPQEVRHFTLLIPDLSDWL